MLFHLEVRPDIHPGCHHPLTFQLLINGKKPWNDNRDLQPGMQQKTGLLPWAWHQRKIDHRFNMVVWTKGEGQSLTCVFTNINRQTLKKTQKKRFPITAVTAWISWIFKLICWGKHFKGRKETVASVWVVWCRGQSPSLWARWLQNGWWMWGSTSSPAWDDYWKWPLFFLTWAPWWRASAVNTSIRHSPCIFLSFCH